MDNQTTLLISFLEQVGFAQYCQNEDLKTLVDTLEIVTLSPGYTLLTEGDKGSELYLLWQGQLQVYKEISPNQCLVIGTIRAGAWVGELQVLLGGERLASVRASEASQLIRFSKAKILQLNSKYPALNDYLVGIAQKNLKELKFTTLLYEMFGLLDQACLIELQDNAEWLQLHQGDRLFAQGDEGDSLYFLLEGRLNAVVADISGHIRRKVSIRPGEVIGEMSILTDESRSASVYALRDSVLIRYHGQQFKQIIEQYPTLLLRITERLIDRFKQRESGVQSPEKLDRRIAILPHDQDTPLAAFSTQLVSCLSTHGRVLQLNSRYLVESLDFPESMDFSPHSPHGLRFQLWLARQEGDYDFILFEADQDDSPWTQFCMGQVDQIVWLTWGEADPSLSLLEQRIQTRQNSVTRLKQTLVLIHPASCKLPTQTRHWLEPRTLDLHHHIRWQYQQDLERLARFLANRAVGVALGGGGGRGAAHIGVLQALKEANIPVDFIGGTSIGGLIASQYAMGWSLRTMVQKNKEITTPNPFNTYTIPMVSLLHSKKLDRMLQDVYADIQIEDLWLNFFCVSTNISAGEKVVHRRGPLWQANRATIALAGVFAPFIDNGDLLIDGGGLDNDPSLTMGELHTGPIILSSVVPRFVPKVRFTYETVPSAFKMFWSWLNPWSSPIDFPNLADILAMSMGVNNTNTCERAFAAADLALTPPLDQYGIFDFEAIDEIIQVAYAYATEQLKTCPPQIPSITSPLRVTTLSGLRKSRSVGIKHHDKKRNAPG